MLEIWCTHNAEHEALLLIVMIEMIVTLHVFMLSLHYDFKLNITTQNVIIITNRFFRTFCAVLKLPLQTRIVYTSQNGMPSLANFDEKNCF